MTTTKKLVVAVVALSLALVGVIGGTLAFLVAQSNVVTNTFTYGTITLELAENNKTDKDGMLFENVVPGDELKKDPTVTVVQGSEKCYVYVLIDNQLGTAASYNINANWEEVSRTGNKTLYRYTETVDASDAAKDLPVFTTLTFADTLTADDLAALKDKNVVIKAYAHQAEHVELFTANTAAIEWANAN